ncbi:hypothetical protein MC885_014717, partial [Smutsia gigantea]
MCWSSWAVSWQRLSPLATLAIPALSRSSSPRRLRTCLMVLKLLMPQLPSPRQQPLAPFSVPLRVSRPSSSPSMPPSSMAAESRVSSSLLGEPWPLWATVTACKFLSRLSMRALIKANWPQQLPLPATLRPCSWVPSCESSRRRASSRPSRLWCSLWLAAWPSSHCCRTSCTRRSHVLWTPCSFCSKPSSRLPQSRCSRRSMYSSSSARE